jgi:putative ABC transport system permease protein
MILRIWYRFRAGLRALVRRRTLEQDMQAEMSQHLARATERYVASGLSPSDARNAARREFGNIGLHQENVRDIQPARWIDSLLGDIRFAFRFFARKPLSSATIVLALALGIGGYAAVFGFVQSAIMRPLSPAISRDVPLVLVNGTVRDKDQPNASPMLFSYTALREMSNLRTIFSAITGWTENNVVVDVPGALDRAATHAQFVADGYFPVLGLRPALGSGFPAADPAAPAESHLMAVISDAMWEDAFGRKDVSNRTMMVNGVAVRIVGVAPPRFNGLEAASGRLTMWLPLAARATVLGGNGGLALSSADSTLFNVIGRLQPGVSPEQATAAARVAAMQARGGMTLPVPAAGRIKMPLLVYDVDVVLLRHWSGAVKAALGLPAEGNQLGPILGVFGSVATLLLLVVCTNVAALVVSTSVGRRQEIAVRLSLGASRVRVVRQMLTESVILAVIGGSLGLVVYWLVIVAISRIPIAEFFRPDLGTVAFTMCVALGTGILCGLAPALHATRDGVATALKDSATSATRRSRLQHAFVIAQVMLTQPLLLLVASAIGGLVMETKEPLRNGTPERVLELRVDVGTIPGSGSQKRAAVERVVRRIGEQPGVVTTLVEPAWFETVSLAVRSEDRRPVASSANPVRVGIQMVTPGYFDLIGVPLLRGDDLASTTDTSATVIIGSDLARQLWGDADPIGRHFVQASPVQTVRRDVVVSGVYDSRYMKKTGNATTYRAVKTSWSDAYLIRTTVPASDLVPSIRQIMRQELPSTPIGELTTLAERDAADARERKSIQAGAAACGALVLVLSSIGLYGAVALGVGQRRREIGVRMALGARAGQVVTLFYAGGVRLGILGLVLGLPVSVAGNYWLNSFGGNPDTTPNIALIGGIVAAVVLVVASVATLIPAIRAARVNPVTVLSSD